MGKKTERKKKRRRGGGRKGYYGDWRGVIVAYESAGLPSGALQWEWEVVGGLFKSREWMWAKMKITKSEKGRQLLSAPPRLPPSTFCRGLQKLPEQRRTALSSSRVPGVDWCGGGPRLSVFFFAFRFVCLLWLFQCRPLFILFRFVDRGRLWA